MPRNAESLLPVMLEYFGQNSWAIQETYLQRMVEIVERHYAGVRLTAEEIQAATAGKRDGGDREYEYDRETRTAILPISGVIAKHARMVNGVSTPRGTSLDTLRGQLADALADRQVERILLEIESPGGSIAGLADFAAEVYEAGFVKPVVAFADDMAASAAYWIGSQAQAFYANQTAVVGSIGLFQLLVDSSARAKEMGLKIHIIRTGKHKGVGAPGVAISKENLTALEDNVEREYGIFLAAIMRGRAAAGMTMEGLRQLADGRDFIGAEGIEVKLIDGIRTRRQILGAEWPAAREVSRAATDDNNRQTGTNKEIIMNDEKQVKTAAADPNVLAQQAAAAERMRIQAIQSALSDECLTDVRAKAIAEGWSVEKAQAEALPVIRKAAAEREAKLIQESNEKQQRLDAIATGGSEVEAPDANDADEEGTTAGTGDDGRAETYDREVSRMIENGRTKADAHREAAIKMPKSHQAWINGHPSNMSE